MANEMHKLFEQSPDEDEPPEYEEIGVINVARLIGTRKIPDVRSYRADEIPDLEAAAKLFGSGEYLFVARRLHPLRIGPDEEKPAGSIYRKRIHVIGSEYGPWLRMLDRAPVPAPPTPNGTANPNGAGGYAGAPAAPLPGMPPPEVASSPMFMMMWMMHQQGMRDSEARREQQARDEAARREQIERDRIAADKSEAEARRQHEMTMAMLQKHGDGGANGVPQMFGQFAEVLGKVHAPPPAPAPPAPSVGALVGDLETLAKAAKLLKGNDDIELVKAIGEGLGGLAGLGSLFGKGGGLSGAPAT